ncbi:FeoA domain protein [Novipirellula aureliae]|uniref:FeoA domain protein n=1 Tax=Novipirellula aureliae TaxID=2527966 RepID=A0A5C6DRR3_9BACT|nr:FeoA family protein [Novipirellula aureliae]TWU38904.1 FeoA domain protein [Novipirellula aureliae]
MTTLDQLMPGQFGQIVRVDGFDSIASRLREMGFIPGQAVQFVQTAPLGDPMRCSVQGSRIAVRSGEARRVYIEPIVKPCVASQS